jgi:hypothetical protein
MARPSWWYFALCLPLLPSCALIGLRRQVEALQAHGAITIQVIPTPTGNAPTYALAWIVENGQRTASAGFQRVRPDGLPDQVMYVIETARVSDARR